MSEEDRHLRFEGESDCEPAPLPTLRHSCSHIMAQAVKQLFPDVKLAIGPAIEDGFYYDFAKPEPFTSEDLLRIEQRMSEIIVKDLPFVREERPREAAIRFFEERGEPFKVEILKGIDAATVSLYRQGDFVDLCRGPHVPSTGHIRAFKLLSCSGAYWRGSEKNPMLQRIYGTAWLSREDLDKYLWRLEEAKKRDHRKLGRELDLFVFQDVSPGAAFWLPKGMVIFRELERFWRDVHDARGYQEISTPVLVHKRLWEQSGHWDHYRENMFLVEAEEQIFSLKPMNCPESTYVYRHHLRSYRDLPLRFSELGRLYRFERSGTLAGMFRVRQFTQDDAHIYCRPDQLQAEIMGVLEIVQLLYGAFGFEPRFFLSTKPEKAMGDPALWQQAEAALQDALAKRDLPHELRAGEGAFYGPKIDVVISDVLGRDWQLATIQLDFVMLPERFALEYIDADGQPKRPVAIHRAIYGSFERFVGILTEHFAGAFPTWLAPVQARVLPVSEKVAAYGRSVFERLREAGIRAELDDRNEKLNYRIREAQLQKIPYMLIVGARESQDGTVSVRRRTDGDAGVVAVEGFLAGLAAEISSRSVTLTVGRS
ncbi:MAG: threonyl-tRNA synthetase, threonyl-tRNA synthetase [Candidatus Rokubacteria bacterium CSP1-6]|nr:MAG: threonyl-tRNA synthetase, threonyl-tRNA synthetase [Candidatus Rokubacteria bacterium CSP1-6]